MSVLGRGLGLYVALLAGCNPFEGPKGPATPESTPAEASSPSTRIRDGFEGDSLEAFWLPGDHGSGRYAPGAVVLSTVHSRSGAHSAQITVRKGDVEQLGDSGQQNERAELDSGKRPGLNRDLWCGFSFLVPADFPIVDVRLVLSQWKQSGLEGSPLVAQRFVNGRHHVTVRDVETKGKLRSIYDLPAILPGRWNDMVYRVRFATDSTGVVEVWMNGEKVAGFNGPTASSDGEDAFYHKVGLYRDRMAEPMTIYIDNYSMGENFDEVDPARFGR